MLIIYIHILINNLSVWCRYVYVPDDLNDDVEDAEVERVVGDMPPLGDADDNDEDC
jgi:hypothetical protein